MLQLARKQHSILSQAIEPGGKKNRKIAFTSFLRNFLEFSQLARSEARRIECVDLCAAAATPASPKMSDTEKSWV